MKKKEKMTPEERAEIKKEKKSWNWTLRMALKKGALVASLFFALFLCSCNKYCEPSNIKSGKSLQHLDKKPFKAQIRIMWVKQYGSFCKVRYENMKEVTDRVYEDCNCGKFIVGTWVNEDTI